ncbi:MAG: hypothetical protein ACUZ8E_09740 [Candidatus Anammoxibacter sp.]
MKRKKKANKERTSTCKLMDELVVEIYNISNQADMKSSRPVGIGRALKMTKQLRTRMAEREETNIHNVNKVSSSIIFLIKMANNIYSSFVNYINFVYHETWNYNKIIKDCGRDTPVCFG